MKTKIEIEKVFSMNGKEIEKAFDIKLRNGQQKDAIIKALNWVLK